MAAAQQWLVRLATENDASVAGGFLTVSVRPWHVMMQSGGGRGVTTRPVR